MSVLKRNEIHLWLVEDQTVTDPHLLATYQDYLDREERQRYQRLMFPKHRKQFLVSRALLRCVLAQYLETAPEAISFARNAYGKPRIASFNSDIPLSFNLSHTNELSVLAVTWENDIGVDVEYLTRKVDILKLARRYFSTRETEALQALDVSQFNDRFFDLWTLKEAYIKACGMGLAIPLKDFSFSFRDAQVEIGFAPERQDNPSCWQFWQYRFKQQFQIALALKHPPAEKARSVIMQQGIPLLDFESCNAELTFSSL